MATLTTLLTDASNPSRDIRIGNTGRRLMRYMFDITFLPADGTDAVNLGTIYPELLVESATLSFTKLPSEVGAQKFVFTATAVGDADGIGSGNLVALPAAGSVEANYSLLHQSAVAAVDYHENYSATVKFVEPPSYDVSTWGLNLEVHLDAASTDPGGIHLKGYVTLAGYDLGISAGPNK